MMSLSTRTCTKRAAGRQHHVNPGLGRGYGQHMHQRAASNMLAARKSGSNPMPDPQRGGTTQAVVGLNRVFRWVHMTLSRA